MTETAISVLDDAELDAHERRAEEMAIKLNTSVNGAIDTVRLIRAEWRACCDCVASGRTEDAHAKRADFEKVVVLQLPRLRHLSSQVDRAAGVLPHEIKKAAELSSLLEWLEQFHDMVLTVWTGPDVLEQLAGEHYPLSSAELDAIGARNPAPAAWYEEDSKPF
jgi:hypothetical protein